MWRRRKEGEREEGRRKGSQIALSEAVPQPSQGRVGRMVRHVTSRDDTTGRTAASSASDGASSRFVRSEPCQAFEETVAGRCRGRLDVPDSVIGAHKAQLLLDLDGGHGCREGETGGWILIVNILKRIK